MAHDVLTIQVDSELRQAFARAVRARGHTEAGALNEFMRDYVRQAHDDAEQDIQRRRKAAAGRAGAGAGDLSTEQVEAPMAELRAELVRRAQEADRRARRR